jgi:hypothetical protein
MNKRTYAFLFMMAAWYGNIGALSVFIQGDQFSSCQGLDLCYCVNHGLTAHGVLERYCLLIYPNATWDAQPRPDLGLP